MTETNDDLRNTVQDYYAERAETSTSCCGPTKLYNADLLIDLPEDVSNFSLGCGNPVTAANLQEGEYVLDLGSGGGLDCFLSAKAVGDTGFVIGVDMTPEMLQKASNAAKKMGLENVDFRKGYLEELPVDDDSMDVVISNCVINLSPDKNQVFAEIFRTLKRGGRISVSDIVTQVDLPEDIVQMKDSWSACAAGALKVEEYVDGLAKVGFEDIKVSAKDNQGNVFDKFPDQPLFSALISAKKP